MKTSSAWSPLSNVTVRLSPSRDYPKLLVLMYGLTVVALFSSQLPYALSVILTLGLVMHAYHAWGQKTPGARCSELYYTQRRWLVLDDTTGELLAYTKARVRFDFTWLMWLVFEDEKAGKSKRRLHVLIFGDQMRAHEHHLLRLALRVQ